MLHVVRVCVHELVLMKGEGFSLRSEEVGMFYLCRREVKGGCFSSPNSLFECLPCRSSFKTYVQYQVQTVSKMFWSMILLY